tara:strand:+ start:164 stop:388 length:225 start_codon:yes stop_codon:yes gene_type:complete
MQNENDSLARTAHVFGMTDLEFEQRAQLESELAAQQVIRARMELEAQEEADRQALKEFTEQEDFDWGFHDQHDF